ncbi:MUC1 protein, partial [Balaeniceps rex]|nr:MUC1 protein [Balaeniceps rex]
TEMTDTDTTTTGTTTKATTTPLNTTVFKTTSGNGTQTSVSSHTTASPATGTTANFQSSNSSAGNTATTKGTAAPVSSSTAISHANATTNSSNLGTTTIIISSTVPTSSTEGNRSSSSTHLTAVSPATGTTTNFHGSPEPSEATVQLLLRIRLSFLILNRSFNESLRDPTSKEYGALSHTVLIIFERVFGCASCAGGQSYRGCSELSFSQGSVRVQATLLFEQGNDTITGDSAGQQLKNSLGQGGFIMDLQLGSIRSSVEMTSPAPASAVPGWAIALLVLVCILLLLSILTCLLLVS